MAIRKIIKTRDFASHARIVVAFVDYHLKLEKELNDVVLITD